MTPVYNHSLAFAGHLLKIPHPSFDYGPIAHPLRVCSLETKRVEFNTHFVSGLINEHLNASRLINKISFRVPILNTRSLETFFHTFRTNYMYEGPLVRGMQNINSDSLYNIIMVIFECHLFFSDLVIN